MKNVISLYPLLNKAKDFSTAPAGDVSVKVMQGSGDSTDALTASSPLLTVAFLPTLGSVTEKVGWAPRAF